MSKNWFLPYNNISSNIITVFKLNITKKWCINVKKVVYIVLVVVDFSKLIEMLFLQINC